MAAAIAHEINNPLEAVTNLAYLLATNPSLNEEARSYADMLLSEVARASAITHQTLAFHRDNSKPSDIRIARLFEDLLRLHKLKFDSRGIRTVCDFDDSAVVWGYGSELRQVLANLLLNAVEAIGHNGEVRLRIRVCGSDRSRVCITVADNGCGIPPQVRSRIFEPFFTTKVNTGNGLGLWISLGIVEKHEGSIRVRTATSAGLRGTVFRVVLPRYPQLSGSGYRDSNIA
jgi:signal transduction histidine kinase